MCGGVYDQNITIYNFDHSYLYNITNSPTCFCIFGSRLREYDPSRYFGGHRCGRCFNRCVLAADKVVF